MRVYRIGMWVGGAIGLVAVALIYWVSFFPQDTRPTPSESLSFPDKSRSFPMGALGPDSGMKERPVDTPVESGAQVPPPPPLPEPHSPFLNADVSVAYTGSAACSECHADEHRSYLGSKHSRAMAEVEPNKQPPDATVDHAPSDQQFTVERRNGQLWHANWFSLADGGRSPIGELPMHYTVGSGHFGHSYLSQVDGYLVQSPLTWYTPRAAWNMSPGYDQPMHLGFRRLVSTGCLFCHAGRVETSENNEFRAKIVEYSIGCERCHGPGSLHVGHHTNARAETVKDGSEIDRTIVNPAHLSRELAESVCQQCHLQGDVNVAVRGRRVDNFRPGLSLQDFRIDYRRRTDDPQMTIVGHVEQLHASACYRGSKDLTCTTCHAPHHSTAESNAAAPSRAACLRCHGSDQKTVCRVPQEQRQREAENDCIRCHMPSSPTELPHVAFTHHRIGVFPIRETNSVVDGKSLEPILDISGFSQPERDRALGLASWKLYEKSGDSPAAEEHHIRAVDLLNKSYQSGFRDPEVTSLLAENAQQRKDFALALQLAFATLNQSTNPTDARVTALTVLAEIRFQEQRFEESRAHYRELAGARRHARPFLYLGMCEQNCGDTQAAIVALQKSLEIEPIQTGAHVALASIYQATGKKGLGDEHRRKAKQIQNYWQSINSPKK